MCSSSFLCFRMFMEGDTSCVSHRLATRLSAHGQAFDSVVGDASSADGTGLQVPAAA